MLLNNLRALFHPEQYHGWGKTRKYFEGWYYKVINAEENKAFAFIPGIAMDEKGRQQAFVQVLDGKKLTSEYYSFGARDFFPETGKFEIRIANNFFTRETLKLDLPAVKGELQFNHLKPWPNKWYSPGVMGPFAFVPFMECYHGILSMDHTIRGQLTFQQETIDFSEGRGYLEKDWGHSFPSAYVWAQTNHFSQPGIAFKASVAKIPWLRNSFVGFIAGVWMPDRLFEFTTYNFTRLRQSFIDPEKVELVMENGKHRLEVFIRREEATPLASPISGFMAGRIEESMTATVEVQLFDKKTKKILLQDRGRNAGLEVAGKVEEIIVG